MGVGTSLGAYFDDSFHQSTAQWDPKYDTNEISPQTLEDNKNFAPPTIPVSDTDTKPSIVIPITKDPVLGNSSNSYNTPLSPDQQKDYDTKFSPQDSTDYDMQGWYLKNQTVDPHTDGTHYPDTWKKPSHPTFSDQSIYSGPDSQGGQWTNDDKGGDIFTPGPQNLKNGIDTTKDYLKWSDPNVKLNYEDPSSKLSIVNAFKGMLNPSTDEDKNILSGVGSTIKNAFTLPGDVLSGKVAPGSVQEIERAADLAGLVVGGPAPVAAKAADGTLGSFMGVKSATVDKAALYKANDLHLQNVHPDSIWAETGSFKGADGRWRQEIDDSTAKLHDSAFNKTLGQDATGAQDTVSIKGFKPRSENSIEDLLSNVLGKKDKLSLDKVLDHPELFKAYPELRGITVERMPEAYKENIGMMRGGRELFLRDNLHPDFAKQVILHETQHAIQEIEGFARGGTPKEFLPPELGQAKKEFEGIRSEAEANSLKEMNEKFPKNEDIYNIDWYKTSIREEMKTGKTDSTLSNLKKYTPEAYKRLTNIVKSEDLIHEAETKAFKQYQALGGEVESRNVEARMNYDKFRRAFVPPDKTAK